MRELLIEEKSGIQHNKVGTFLDVGNDLRLERQGVEIRKNHGVELPYMNHCFAFLFAFRIKFPNNKNKKTK